MAFVLRIHFTGLCLLVPDPSPPAPDPRPCLHAVLPEHSDHPHEPRLVYDRAYTNGGATKLEGFLCCERLKDRAVRFEGFGSEIDPATGFGTAARKLPDDVVDLSTMAGTEPLRRAFVQPDPGSAVASRLSLYVGRYEWHRPPPLWRIKGKPNRRITNVVQWSIPGLITAPVSIPLADLRTTGEPVVKTLRLHPIHNEIKVWVYNVTPDDLPPPVNPQQPHEGDTADHFVAYYGLFEYGDRDIPELAETPQFQNPEPVPSECRSTRKGLDARPVPGAALGRDTAHTATCITAQTPIG